jgi:hypothetical protein
MVENEKQYPPLLSPGIHELHLSDLQRIAVDEIEPSARRADIWNGFLVLYQRLLRSGLAGLDLWVDGSFLTTKPRPNDIDCVLWIPKEHIDSCTEEQYKYLMELRDIAAVQRKYCVHLFLAPADDLTNIDYWQNWFGTYRDQTTPKGFACVAL